MWNIDHMSENSKKWLNHYLKLVLRGKTRINKHSKRLATNLLGYVESHHIVPKSMSGSNNEENLVFLTPEEHFVAHQLLTKIFPNNPSLAYSANMMCVATSDVKRNNKSFGWIRKRIATATGNRFRGNPLSDDHKNKLSKIGKGRSNIKLIGKKQTPESNVKRSEKLKGRTFTEEHKNKIGLSHKNKPLSQQHKENLSKSKIGRSIKTRTENSYKVQSIKRKNNSKWGCNYNVNDGKSNYVVKGIWNISEKFNICISSIKGLIRSGKVGKGPQSNGISITKI